jgi:drug/metabolite transporter (DMT)-like permease
MKELALLLFCNLLWSFVYVIAKSEFKIFHPLEISFLRNFFALIPAFIFVIWGGQNSILTKWIKNGVEKIDFRFVLAGFCSFFMTPILAMTGLSMSRASDSALIVGLEPLVTIALAMIVFKEKLTFRFIISILLSVVGVFLLSNISVAKLLAFRDEHMIGNFIYILAVFFESTVSIFAKPVLDRRDPILFLAISIATGCFGLFFFNIIFGDANRLSGLQPLLNSGLVSWLKIGFLGIFCTTFAFWVWIKLLPRVPLSRMSLTIYLQPLLGMLWGAIFLRESLTVRSGISAVFILLGIAIGTKKDSFEEKI